MISIIVPIYNEEEVLSSFIKTFFNDIKLKEDFELILVNDGSEDNTKKLIMKRTKKDSDYHIALNPAKLREMYELIEK